MNVRVYARRYVTCRGDWIPYESLAVITVPRLRRLWKDLLQSRIAVTFEWWVTRAYRAVESGREWAIFRPQVSEDASHLSACKALPSAISQMYSIPNSHTEDYTQISHADDYCRRMLKMITHWRFRTQSQSRSVSAADLIFIRSSFVMEDRGQMLCKIMNVLLNIWPQTTSYNWRIFTKIEVVHQL